uniref:Ig-like domain-containing protein n=1 Tax=Oreochromis niloticus TaxID=8128 RepID=A0A669BU20_ORENI
MLSLHHCVFPSWLLLLLTAINTQKSSLEDSTVTLSCSYSKPVVGTYYFFWYQQYPGKPPKFLISHSDKGQLISDPVIRLSVKVNETLMTLQISSAAVTDSAVYYCAVRPTVTGNTKTLYKNLWSKDNRILHNIH